jgi:hypothetical protein
MYMRIDEILSNPIWLTRVKQTFSDLGLEYSNPILTTVKNLHAGAVGKHTGLYIIYTDTPEGTKFYYLGIATGSNSIRNRFQPHYAKLTVNLAAMYGPNTNDRAKETRWKFPKNWRKGVRQHFLDNPDDIPDYWIRNQNQGIKPANLDWKPQWKQGVEIDNLPVVIWNLNYLNAQQIDALETALILSLKPVFNGAKTKI